MPFIGSTTSYGLVTPALADTVPLVQGGALKQSLVSGLKTVADTHAINAQTGTTYAIVAADRGKHLTISNAASIAVSIAQAGTTGFENGYFVFIENISTGVATITPTTSTINGSATFAMASNTGAILFSDGTNYRAMVFRVGLPDGDLGDVTKAGDVLTVPDLANKAEYLAPRAESGSFTILASNHSNRRTDCSSGSAISATWNTGHGMVTGDSGRFVQTGAGALTIIDGTGTVTLAPNVLALGVTADGGWIDWEYLGSDEMLITGVGTPVNSANSQSANYTTIAADSGKSIDHPSSDANARTFTIDSNANVPYAVGTPITFTNMTANVVTIAITSDTMYLAGAGTTGSRSLAQYGIATARKLTSTTWLISGTGLT